MAGLPGEKRNFLFFSLIFSIFFSAVLISLYACKKETPEDRIRRFISRGEDAAAEKDIGELKTMISDNYLDPKGRKKQDLEAILTYYFFRQKSIYLYTEIRSLELPGPRRAEVTLYLAMAGRRIAGPGELAGMRADLYRFDFDLVRRGEDEWLLSSADWRAARLEDFFPEAVDKVMLNPENEAVQL